MIFTCYKQNLKLKGVYFFNFVILIMFNLKFLYLNPFIFLILLFFVNNFKFFISLIVKINFLESNLLAFISIIYFAFLIFLIFHIFFSIDYIFIDYAHNFNLFVNLFNYLKFIIIFIIKEILLIQFYNFNLGN
uniref:hypothetical protein n=1 Tax=Neorhodella cyanea TaxID=131155 RepID=UPI001FCDB5B0|nr:hypothetical protein MW616_mgp02 [Neorhodella cyanea]UNJ18812.1 hypothetical protein [Neorhodella cyanea]